MKKILKFLPAVFAAVALVVATSLSWLAIENPVNFPDSFSGSTRVSYFAGGDGSKKDPYLITTRTHMYNLAWLQYLGYFNLGGYINNGRAQSFFKLAFDGAGLDMEGLALPPIGTKEYPFIGNFDGNGKVVYNFIVSNTKNTAKSTDYNLKVYPRGARFDDNGVLTTTGTVTDNSTRAQVDIIGMFGVAGDLTLNASGDSFVTSYYTKSDLNKHKYGEDGKTLIPIPETNADGTAFNPAANDFYYSGMKISGFYIDRVKVNSESAKSLVGILAGYICSSVQNTGVYRSKISVAAETSGGVIGLFDSTNNQRSYDTVVSKYSLVGDYDEKLVGWSEDPAVGDGEQPGGWGGSIDMLSLHNRLLDFKKNASFVNMDTYADASSGGLRFFDEDKGSVYFTSRSVDTMLYTYGGKSENVYSSENVPNGGFFIKSGNNYLTLNGLSVGGARTATTDPNKAVTWYYDSSDRALYTYVKDTKYYLNLSYTVLNVSSSQTMNWIMDYDNNYLYYVTGKWSYYLNYRSQWGGDDSESALTFDTTGKNLISNINYTYTGIINGEDRSFATYIPILTNDDYTVSDANPGYIASGSTTIESNSVTGDFRTNIRSIGGVGGIYRSINGEKTFGTGATFELLTKTKNSNEFVRIKDDFNSENGSVHSSLSGYDKTSVSDLKLKAYTKAREKLNELLLNKTTVCGMHFMNAPINEDNVLVAPKVKINGITHYSYEIPANALTFSAPSKGYVAFFAGTYYGSDKNFFSLHRIIRNADTSISQIKEISQIYSKSGSEYIYLYSDGTYSDTLSAGYELEFDCDWIINPEIVSNTAYYFEIPVNKGDEYALGSATTGAGAYIMYLDIGANGDDGSGGSGETQTLPYLMESVDFVSMSATDTSDTLSVPNGGYPSYNDVGFKLGGDGTSVINDEVFFKREKHSADVTGDINTTVYYWRQNENLVCTLVPSDSPLGAEDETKASW